MAEVFTNNAQSTLDGAINNSVTSLDVIDASEFPSGGDFRIIIDDEIMLVTAVAAETFTVTRGHETTTAASHSNGATVSHVLTAGAIEAIRASEANVEPIVEDFLVPGWGISLTPGGGTLTVEAFFIHSIVQSAGALALDGDTATPGNNYFYSTSGSGTKGWNQLPTTYSITTSSGVLQLDGDTSSPGNLYFYSTNGSGNKGWNQLPTTNSITTSSGSLELTNDSSSPGSNYFYGTSGAGTKGWYALPAGAESTTVSDTNTIDLTLTTYNISGDVRYQQSITSDSSGIKLDGDQTSPGNDYFYGTNGSGTKGWYAVAGGSSDFDTEYEVDTDNAIKRLDTNEAVGISTNGTSAVLIANPGSGDARGNAAIDLQVNRSSSSMVAAGVHSAIVGGANNTVYGYAEDSGVFVGTSNNCAGIRSVILGGTTNEIVYDEFSGYNAIVAGSSNEIEMGYYNGIFAGSNNHIEDNTGKPNNCVILGGNQNYIQTNGSVDNNYSAIVGGYTNSMAGIRNVILGGQNCVAYSESNGCVLIGEYAATSVNGNIDKNVFVHGHNHGDTIYGGAQYERWLTSNSTTDATANVPLAADGIANTKNVTIYPGIAATMQIHVVAWADDGSHGMWILNASVINTGFGASIVHQGGSTDYSYISMGNTYSVTILTSGDVVYVAVTGELSRTVKWLATWHITKVYATITGSSS